MNTFNSIVTGVLWTSTILVLGLLIHQLFFSKRGIPRHRKMGKLAMYMGGVIALVVIIRGFQQEKFTLVYGMHLVLGSLFFYLLFRTGYLGYQVSKGKEYLASSHKRMARRTLWFLTLTLIAGIIAFLSHQKKSVNELPKKLAVTEYRSSDTQFFILLCWRNIMVIHPSLIE